MLENRSAYGWYGEAGGYTGEVKPYTSTRMSYREYKTRWADHEIVRGSYDKEDKTIEVIFSEEEMKAKTNLGNRYQLCSYYFKFSGVERGVESISEFRAKNFKNAEKNAKAYARKWGYTFEREATLNEYIDAHHNWR